MTTVFTVKLGITGLTPEELLERADAHIVALTGNATFPTPVPTLVQQQADRDALAAANVAMANNGGKQDRLVQEACVAKVKSNLKELAGYVQAVSKGDKPQVQDGAFDVVEPGEPIGELPPPQALGSKLTNMSGRVALDWKGVRGAKSYQVFMSTSNDPFKWELTAVTTKSRLDVDSLEPGTFYWFTVSAVGAERHPVLQHELESRAEGGKVGTRRLHRHASLASCKA